MMLVAMQLSTHGIATPVALTIDGVWICVDYAIQKMVDHQKAS